MCMCLARGGVGGEGGGEWMIGLGLDFTNPVGTGGVLDLCLCFGGGGVRDVGGEWVGGFDQGLEGFIFNLCVQVIDTGYFIAASGDYQSLILCILDFSVVSVT